MATKKEFNKILKDNGLSREELQAIYEDVATTNPLVNNLLNITQVKLENLPLRLLTQLLTQKEKDLKCIEEKRIRQEEKEQEELRIKREAEYYVENFDQIMYNNILSGVRLTERELQDLVWSNQIDVEYGDNGRWSRPVTSIISLCGKNFAILWDEGLTERQENEFYNQPYEVVLKEEERVIVARTWEKVVDKE